ncbi:hypothetical protein KJ975_09745 [Myxococcota bacterium]|nr:hypothetical protein [Myxococcota bacterium]
MSTFARFLPRLLATAAAICLVAYGIGYRTHRHSPVPLPDEPSRRELVRILNLATAGERPSVEAARFPGRYPGDLVLHGYAKGRQAWRCEVPAAPLGKALARCIAQLAADPPPPGLAWRVDLVRSVLPIRRFFGLEALFLLPGLEALQVSLENGQKIVYLPEDMFLAGLLDRHMPLKFVPELRIGVDFAQVDRHVRETTGYEPVGHYRLQLWSILLDQAHPDGYRDVVRVHLTPPEITRERVLEAANAGGRYMVNALIRDPLERFPCTQRACRHGYFTAEPGQFLYNYNIVTGLYDFQNRNLYNLVRHAGTTYSLANLYLITRDPSYADAASRAIAYLVGLAGNSCSQEPFRCVANDLEPCLGSASLTLLAVAEYRLATGDAQYDEFARGLAKFLLYMQRPDGSFRHIYNLKTRQPDEKQVLLFYSGEAAFALAKAFRAYGERSWLDAAVLALDHLTGPATSPLPFHFGFGEEHWTCQAAREVAPEVMKPRFLEFCLDFSHFIERQQFTKTDTAFPDFSGSYGFSPFLPPHTNGAGSRTEANVSILELARLHGVSAPHVERQIRRAVEHIITHQKRPGNCWLCADMARADGAVVNTLTTWDVRIDTVQHVTSGLIRASRALYP